MTDREIPAWTAPLSRVAARAVQGMEPKERQRIVQIVENARSPESLPPDVQELFREVASKMRSAGLGYLVEGLFESG